jgi:hypothetical protein
MVSLPMTAQAAAPQTVNYQGVLTDSGGVPLNSSVNVDLRVYDAATAGTLLYSESHLGVVVSNGLFGLPLGGGSPLTGTFDANLFDTAGRWLEIVVDGEVQSPRQAFLSVPYALQTENAAQLEGNAASAFALAADLTTQIAALQSQIDALNSTVGTVQGDISTVQSNINALQSDISTVQGDISTIQADVATNAGNIGTNIGNISANTSGIVSNASAISGLQAKTQYVSVSGTEMYITGANLNIRSGSGVTNGAINGLGNLVVGYNEDNGDNRTGSHNIVIGPFHSYSSYGGLLAGYNNTVSGANASISGGYYNTASGAYASVSAGVGNTASGFYSSVSGGAESTANGTFSSVSGGRSNTASGTYASVVGGGYFDGIIFHGNEAYADYSLVVGGYDNQTGDGVDPANGTSSVVLGGVGNTASGNQASISGGSYNTASGNSSSVSGGYYNTASGSYTSVVGGGYTGGSSDGNEAYANYSVVVGGYQNRTGDGLDPTVAQASAILAGQGSSTTVLAGSFTDGTTDTAITDLLDKTQYLAVSGTEMYITGANLNIRSGSGSTDGTLNGLGNLIIGYNEAYVGSIRTGSHNLVVGNYHSYSSYAGLVAGKGNYITAPFTSVSGGNGNTASNAFASVSGGAGNTASGNASSVSGGAGHDATGGFHWRAGSLFENQ